jgi:hypothetical protein
MSKLNRRIVLFIVEKSYSSPAGLTHARWQQDLSTEMAMQPFDGRKGLIATGNTDNDKQRNSTNMNRSSYPFRVPLTWLRAGKEVGLGDLIKRTTNAFGIKQCPGCVRRAEALNRGVLFSGRTFRK